MTSKPSLLAILDHERRLVSSPDELLKGRSHVGRRLRAIKRELTEHLGGPDRVTAPQRFLIERLAIDLVRLELLDLEMTNGTISEHDARVAHALRNSTRLALKDLGFTKPLPAPAMTAVEYGRALDARRLKGGAA